MVRSSIVIAAAGAAMLLSVAASASTYASQKFRCPVGGKTFTATVQLSMTSFGARPDGKTYDTGRAPKIECPDNGFVFYKDKYSKAEEARLAPLVEGVDYRAMRVADTAEGRSAWLAAKMNESAEDVAFAWLVASWSSDGDAVRKTRYQQAFVAAVQAVPATSEYRKILDFRAANALRELGRPDESDAILKALELRVSTITEAEERAGFLKMIAALHILNAEGNHSAEPVTMVPDEIAADLCINQTRQFSTSEQARCESTEIREVIERFARNRASAG